MRHFQVFTREIPRPLCPQNAMLSSFTHSILPNASEIRLIPNPSTFINQNLHTPQPWSLAPKHPQNTIRRRRQHRGLLMWLQLAACEGEVGDLVDALAVHVSAVDAAAGVKEVG